MLPTEPKSQLTVSQANKPMSNSIYRAFSNPSLRQFANQTGRLIIKHPFWVLVIGSFGIHTAFALIAANPLKKTEPPREVIVSTLPVVKLPAKPPTINSKPNKSLLDNLFVNPSTNKLGVPPNSFPNSFSSSFPSSSLSSLDENALDRLEDDLLPPITTNLPLEVPPLLNSPINIPRDIALPDFVKPQTRVSVTQTPAASRFTPSGQLDNSTPPKAATNSSTPKLDFPSSGLKNIPNISSPEPQNLRGTAKDLKGIQGSTLSNLSNNDRDEKEIINISSLYTTDKQIIDLVEKNLIKTTQIAPDEAMVSNPELNREKGVAWIPPKMTNISGKKGSVTFMWLVAPDGKVEAKFLKSSGNKELDAITRETVKDYKFAPIEDPKSGKYRLVTAKYDFPYL